ncbi:MAG: SulP family inorganic anion transporter [Candidatus Melainabacteria bacterium]|nr:SulP family inorganic anion transporter [Candidatus Melainabacteria bacterium]
MLNPTVDKTAPESSTSPEKKKNYSVEIWSAIFLLCIALPLNVGVAIASGVPAEFGIISGAIAALVTGSLSASPVLISGPDAGIGVLVFEIIQKHGIQSLGVTVFLAGLMQLTIGLTRSSRWFKAVSPAVVNGMLAGMGLIIVFTQFHIMLDDTPKETGLMNLLLIPEALLKGLTPTSETSHQEAALLGIATIAVACAWVRFAPEKLKQIPNALIAIVTVSAVTCFLGLPVNFVSLPPSLVANVSVMSLSSIMNALGNPELLCAAGMIAFICSAQSLITLSAIDNTAVRSKFAYDKELIAQGIGNTICGALGVLPIVGVLLRSVANSQNGAETRLPNILHGTLMVTAVLLLPKLLQSIPTCVLAATLVLIGVRMVRGILRNVKSYQRGELNVFAITVLAIVCTNLFAGVAIGFVAAAFKQLRELSDLEVRLERKRDSRELILHLKGAATFLQLPKLSEVLERIPEDAELHVRLDKLRHIDHACLTHLIQWERDHQGRLVIDWAECSIQMRRFDDIRRQRIAVQQVNEFSPASETGAG